MGLTPGQIGGIAGGLGDLFQGLFGAAGDLSEAGGYQAEAGAYRTAQKYAIQNAAISQEAGDIKEEQAGRQIFKVVGAQQEEYAGAGLTGGGSAQEVLRSSVSQGALEKAIINEQTQINVTGYKSQAAQFAGMASAADAAASAAQAKAGGDFLGGLFGAAAEILPIVLSDRRLKTDIERVGSHGLLGIYRFRYIGEDKLRRGVMADEVAIHAPHALGPMIEGYATVDYGKLGLSHLVEG